MSIRVSNKRGAADVLLKLDLGSFTLKKMSQLLFCLIVFVSVLCALPGGAHATKVQEFVLDNGLKVLLLEDHKSPVVTFQVWYRVGSRNEKDGKAACPIFSSTCCSKGLKRQSLKSIHASSQKMADGPTPLPALT